MFPQFYAYGIFIFENFTSYSCDKGAEWINTYTMVQFRNFLAFDHVTSGISLVNLNFVYIWYTWTNFFNHITGPALINCTIIGNSNSSSPNSITQSGLVIQKTTRGFLLDSLMFYNFPNPQYPAIIGST